MRVSILSSSDALRGALYFAFLFSISLLLSDMSAGNLLPGGDRSQEASPPSMNAVLPSSLRKDDSIDRHSSTSSVVHRECKRLMESHIQRSEVLQYYKHMLENKREQRQQQQQESPRERQLRDGKRLVNNSPRSARHSAREGMAASHREPLKTVSRTAPSTPAYGKPIASPRGGKGSISWTRSRSAATGTTESFLAKQKPKTNPSPNTPRQREQRSHRLRSCTESCISPSTASPSSSAYPSMILQYTRLRSPQEAAGNGGVSSPMHSLSLRGSHNGPSCSSPRTPIQTLGSQAKHTNSVPTVTASATVDPYTVVSGLVAGSPCRSVLSCCNNIVAQEISTVEDKQQLELHLRKSNALSDVLESRCVTTDAICENGGEQQHPEKQKGDDGNSDELSFMTFETANTIDIASSLRDLRDHEQLKRALSSSIKKRKSKPQDTTVIHCDSIAAERPSHDSMLVNRLTADANQTDENTKTKNAADLLLHNTALLDEDRATCIAAAASMLQGFILQSRHVLPCYYCGKMHLLSAYRLHLEYCRAHTEALYARYNLNPLRLVTGAPKEGIPGYMDSLEQKDAFSKACYESAKMSILSCPECHICVRIHDLHEHSILCRGRTGSGLQEPRVRSTA